MSYDTEIRQKLESCYSSDILNIRNDNTEYFNLLEQLYPIGLNRINWEKVDDRFLSEVDLTDKLNAKISILSFFQEVKKKLNADDELEVIVFGDDSIENAYEMPLYVLEANVMEFFTLPQHTYVIPKDGSWCINYTFEDELFFGISNKVDK